MRARVDAEVKALVHRFPSGYFVGLAWFLLLAFAIIAIDMADGKSVVIGVDDRMRKLQILDLLADGNWRDMAQPYLKMPQEYISPWSRIVDLPYIVFAGLLAIAMPSQAAIELAFLWVPSLMLPVFCALSYHISVYLAGRVPTALSILVMAIVMALAILQFTPGRVDHHNMQLLMFVAAIWGVTHHNSRGGIVTGLACAGSIAIGLEALPLIAALYGLLTLAWATSKPGAGQVLKSAAISIALATCLFAWLRHGNQLIQSVECDAISAPYAVAAIGFGALLSMCVTFERYLGRPYQRLLVVIIGGAMLAGFGLLVFDQCLAGPYGMVDDVSRSFWLALVPGEMDIVTGIKNGRNAFTFILLPAVFFLTLLIPVALHELRRCNWFIAVFAGCALVALMLAAIQLRFFFFPIALVALSVPIFINLLSKTTPVQRQSPGMIPITVAIAGTIVIVALNHFLSGPANSSRVLKALHSEECRGESFAVLSEVKPGRIIAPLGLAMPIAEGDFGHSVAALPFHRASPGIRRVALVFTSKDQTLARQAIAPFDYLAVCRDDTIATNSNASLYVQLMQGGQVEWLTLVSSPQGSRFELFRVDKLAINK